MLTYITPIPAELFFLLFAVFLVVFLIVLALLVKRRILGLRRISILQTHLLKEAHLLGLGFTLDIYLVSRKPCGKPGVLAFLSNGQGQLVIRHDHLCLPLLLVSHYADYLCRT